MLVHLDALQLGQCDGKHVYWLLSEGAYGEGPAT